MNFWISLIGSAFLAHSVTSALAQDITVATWNLAHFSGQDHSGCRERTQADYDEIRNIINSVDADVWLLQEVESAGALARVMDPTAWTFIAEQRPDLERPASCRDNGRSMTMQKTAMAVRRGIMTANHTDLSFLDTSGAGFLRHGLAMNVTFQGRTVQIVNVHLKSGCFDGVDSDACAILFEQVPYLASYATQTSAKELPLLVGGDFNRRLSLSGDEVFQTLSYNRRTGLEIASPVGVSRCSLQDSHPIDYQLTNAHFRDVFEVKESREHTFSGPFKDWPSDHCPVVVTYSLK